MNKNADITIRNTQNGPKPAYAVSLQNVIFSYNDSYNLFQDFSLSINSACLTAIIGPNGCGKSTLLGLILGWLEPQSGKIFLEGKHQHAYDRKSRGRLIGYVSQTSRIPFNYSVFEYVLLGRTPHLTPLSMPTKKDGTLCRKALELAGIQKLSARNLLELSAGELQLVSIARALAQSPRILLLDEPASHLDPANTLRLLHLLTKLVREGISVIVTSHDPVFVRTAADRAVLLKNGSLLHTGTAEQVITPNALTELYGVPFREADDGEKKYPILDH